MRIEKYNHIASADEAMTNDEPLLALISFSGSEAIFSHIDDAVEHHILLSKTGRNSMDIDQYFRIIFDRSGADWTFICPPEYKGVKNKTRRIAEFYKDGYAVISDFLAQIGYPVDISIPKRYRRHFDDTERRKHIPTTS
jgi:hypothetical protein